MVTVMALTPAGFGLETSRNLSVARLVGGGEACEWFRGFDQRLAPRYSEEAGASNFPGWPRNSPWLRHKRGARLLTPTAVIDAWNRARRSVGPIPGHHSEVRTADSDRQSAARESPARDRAQRQRGLPLRRSRKASFNARKSFGPSYQDDVASLNQRLVATK